MSDDDRKELRINLESLAETYGIWLAEGQSYIEDEQHFGTLVLVGTRAK